MKLIKGGKKDDVRQFSRGYVKDMQCERSREAEIDRVFIQISNLESAMKWCDQEHMADCLYTEIQYLLKKVELLRQLPVLKVVA